MQNKALPVASLPSLLRTSLLAALGVSLGLILMTKVQASGWDISEDAFDAAQGGVQVKGWLPAREAPDIQLGGYACRGCQDARPFIYLYLPQGHEGDDPYPITVNGRSILVQGESGDNPDVITDQVPIDIKDTEWWAQQVTHDIPVSVILDDQTWHFDNTNGHRFIR